MPLEMIQHDITQLTVDAIVNAANRELKQGGGVCGAIFQKAGADAMTKATGSLGPIDVGQAVITPGFKLPAKHVIHAVGPIWQGGDKNEEQLLRAAYVNSLELARDHELRSIAFPLISSGIYGYPKAEALSVATSAISHFLLQHDIQVYIVVFDKTGYQLNQKLQRNLENYLRENFVSMVQEANINQTYERNRRLESVQQADVGAIPKPGKSFSETLIELIDASGRSDPEIYKKANIDRKHFSKIRSNPGYQPSKTTALAFAIALELNLNQTEDLLRRAGYALSPSDYRDLIVKYFIQQQNYNIFEINQVLFGYDQALLGM